jgi:hypothetical protein
VGFSRSNPKRFKNDIRGIQRKDVGKAVLSGFINCAVNDDLWPVYHVLLLFYN